MNTSRKLESINKLAATASDKASVKTGAHKRTSGFNSDKSGQSPLSSEDEEMAKQLEEGRKIMKERWQVLRELAK